jgi:hypothetical protein
MQKGNTAYMLSLDTMPKRPIRQGASTTGHCYLPPPIEQCLLQIMRPLRTPSSRVIPPQQGCPRFQRITLPWDAPWVLIFPRHIPQIQRGHAPITRGRPRLLLLIPARRALVQQPNGLQLGQHSKARAPVPQPTRTILILTHIIRAPHQARINESSTSPISTHEPERLDGRHAHQIHRTWQIGESPPLSLRVLYPRINRHTQVHTWMSPAEVCTTVRPLVERRPSATRGDLTMLIRGGK